MKVISTEGVLFFVAYVSLESHSSGLCRLWFGFETCICVDEVAEGEEVRDGQKFRFDTNLSVLFYP